MQTRQAKLWHIFIVTQKEVTVNFQIVGYDCENYYLKYSDNL